MDDRLTSRNVILVLASDLLAETSEGAADNLGRSAFFGFNIFDIWLQRFDFCQRLAAKLSKSYTVFWWNNAHAFMLMKGSWNANFILLKHKIQQTKCWLTVLQLCIFAYPPWTINSDSNEALTKARKTKY